MKALALAAVVVLSPNPSHFGQLVTARVTGGPAPSFAPFSVRGHHGSEYVLQCLDPKCLPGPGPRRIRIGTATAVIVPRTTAAQVAHPLRSFRRQTNVPPPSYRIRPDLLRGLLFAAAALLAAGALVLVYPLVRRLIPEPVDERTPLQRALDLVRASLGRGAEDRRRALDLLGRTLDDDPRASDALELAWSERGPEAASVAELVDAVEKRR
ncbi:MAG TPA: hypothetical protein VGO39_14155 [Gaiellaceae bacterium]|nr:hypothetical protein [Gaiellaceae bacterium]